MDTNDMLALSRRAVAKVADHMAKNAEDLADEIEKRGLSMTGPEALRVFASSARQAALQMNFGIVGRSDD